MSCFSLDFWERVFIAVICVIALWAIIKLFLPWLMSRLPPILVQILNILIWAGIAILCVIIIFGLLACVWGMVGGIFPHSFRTGDIRAIYSAARMLA
jgi:hypothetical protein